MELMANSQQVSNPNPLMTPLVPAQHDHHIFAPKRKMKQPEVSYRNAYIVIAVSPTQLLDVNRYHCEVCYKGFSRKQNLTLHRRSHNLSFAPKKRSPKDPVPRKVYLCPEPTCVHHNRSHALGDFGGVKKHYLRKHCTEKKFKCDTCSKVYSVQTDLKAHLKSCAMKKYICHCGSRFSRRYHFTVHKEDCDAGEHVAAAKDPQTLDMGESGSVKNTINNITIGSTMLHPPTLLGMGNNAIRINSVGDNNTFIGPIPSIQNQFNSYSCTIPFQSQLCQFEADHNSLMTNPSMGLNLIEIPHASFSTIPTHQNQPHDQPFHGSRIPADLLMDKIPLHSVNVENTSLMGNCGNLYGFGEGFESFLDTGFMFVSSSSLNLAPAMHTTSLNGMPNSLAGSSDGGSYEQWNCSGHGGGTGKLDYNGGMEAFKFGTPAPTGGSLAPSVEYLNQTGFWF